MKNLLKVCAVIAALAFLFVSCKTESEDSPTYYSDENNQGGKSGDSGNTEIEKTYTITFNLNDGSANPLSRTQSVIENKTTSLTTADSLGFTRAGYVFAGWNTAQNGSGTAYTDDAEIMVAGNITLYAQWTAGTATKYTVKHYQQNIADNGYTLVEADTQILTGAIDSASSAIPKSYNGFTALPFEQNSIAADGSTVVEIYYGRKIITLTFKPDGGTWLDGTTADKTVSGKYGANVTAPDLPTLTDYTGHWDSEIQAVFLENKSYSVIWVENIKVPYKVTYMLQTLDDNGYQGKNTDTFFGIPGELTDAQAIEIEGFVLSPTHSITQKTITADGKTSVWIYYDRIMVTLTFKSNGGTWKDGTTTDKTISGKYGATVSTNTIPIPTKDNYVFNDWDENVQTIFTKEESYIAQYTPQTITYKVEHYQENAADDDYTLIQTETLSGFYNSMTSASARNYNGFTAQSFEQKTIEDNTVIKIYYNRRRFSLTFLKNDGSDYSIIVEAKEGSKVISSAPNFSRSYYGHL